MPRSTLVTVFIGFAIADAAMAALSLPFQLSAVAQAQVTNAATGVGALNGIAAWGAVIAAILFMVRQERQGLNPAFRPAAIATIVGFVIAGILNLVPAVYGFKYGWDAAQSGQVVDQDVLMADLFTQHACMFTTLAVLFVATKIIVGIFVFRSWRRSGGAHYLHQVGS